MAKSYKVQQTDKNIPKSISLTNKKQLMIKAKLKPLILPQIGTLPLKKYINVYTFNDAEDKISVQLTNLSYLKRSKQSLFRSLTQMNKENQLLYNSIMPVSPRSRSLKIFTIRKGNKRFID